jgi:exopolysaccharide biosynthesis polyprenyl glycosylphosphotransferase
MTHRNIPVFHERALHEQLSGQMDLSHLTGEELEGFQPPRVYFVVKRFGELMVVVVALPLLLLLSLIAAILVKAESTGPVFFRQTRIGLHGQRFSITKFRTMVHNNGNSNKSQFADLQDNRVTRVGRWLRHYRLDEIPQIWNVVRGDMSLIGPRPEQPTFVEQFKTNIPYYDFRHTVRPGITGWAQVRYGYASTEDQTRSKLEYDFFYIKHMSLWLDFNILLRTLRTILLRKGAR